MGYFRKGRLVVPKAASTAQHFLPIFQCRYTPDYTIEYKTKVMSGVIIKAKTPKDTLQRWEKNREGMADITAQSCPLG